MRDLLHHFNKWLLAIAILLSFYFAGKASAFVPPASPPSPPISVTLISTPSQTTQLTNALFSWSVSGNTPTSETCQLDSNVSAPCTTAQPQTYLGPLFAGEHLFSIIVSDGINTSQASYMWTITSSSPTGFPPPPTTFPPSPGNLPPLPITLPPAPIALAQNLSISFLSTPPASTQTNSATFTFSVLGGIATRQNCTLDGVNTPSCASGIQYANLAIGSHTFIVYASNASGIYQGSYTWDVVAVAPTVTFETTPGLSTNSTFTAFQWTTTNSPTSQTCRLDKAPAAPCGSNNVPGDTESQTYSNTKVGKHTFVITVANSAGSAQAVYNWTVDPYPVSKGTFLETLPQAPWTFPFERVSLTFEMYPSKPLQGHKPSGHMILGLFEDIHDFGFVSRLEARHSSKQVWKSLPLVPLRKIELCNRSFLQGAFPASYTDRYGTFPSSNVKRLAGYCNSSAYPITSSDYRLGATEYEISNSHPGSLELRMCTEAPSDAYEMGAYVWHPATCFLLPTLYISPDGQVGGNDLRWLNFYFALQKNDWQCATDPHLTGVLAACDVSPITNLRPPGHKKQQPNNTKGKN
jgi:hypothetical protein